ncbi:MAG: S1C family serine protease, partial [Candidatus Bipolaricaulia bacterium]
MDNLWPVDEIYRFARKSVVEIRVLKTTEGFFERTQSGLGSGFVYDGSGHIVTNQHVVEGAEKIFVKFHNGETVKAKMIGSDPYSDLAVLKIDPTGLDTELVPL